MVVIELAREEECAGETIALGAVMAIGTGTCMLAALTVLPAVLHLLNQFGWSMTRKPQKKKSTDL